MTQQLNYRRVSDALVLANAEIGAAECHGMFCGVLCANGQLNVEAMAIQVLGSLDKERPGARESVQHISQLLSTTMEQLGGDEFRLQLLLPDDDAPLAERSSALGLWCQGFVMGLSAGGVTKDTELQKDSREVILDLTKIAHRLQADDDGQLDVDDEEEAAFIEVEEYVRVGVMLINEELRGQRANQTIH